MILEFQASCLVSGLWFVVAHDDEQDDTRLCISRLLADECCSKHKDAEGAGSKTEAGTIFFFSRRKKTVRLVFRGFGTVWLVIGSVPVVC